MIGRLQGEGEGEDGTEPPASEAGEGEGEELMVESPESPESPASPELPESPAG